MTSVAAFIAACAVLPPAAPAQSPLPPVAELLAAFIPAERHIFAAVEAAAGHPAGPTVTRVLQQAAAISCMPPELVTACRAAFAAISPRTLAAHGLLADADVTSDLLDAAQRLLAALRVVAPTPCPGRPAALPMPAELLSAVPFLMVSLRPWAESLPEAAGAVLAEFAAAEAAIRSAAAPRATPSGPQGQAYVVTFRELLDTGDPSNRGRSQCAASAVAVSTCPLPSGLRCLLFDLLVATAGPRVRDRVAHGTLVEPALMALAIAACRAAAATPAVDPCDGYTSRLSLPARLRAAAGLPPACLPSDWVPDAHVATAVCAAHASLLPTEFAAEARAVALAFARGATLAHPAAARLARAAEAYRAAVDKRACPETLATKRSSLERALNCVNRHLSLLLSGDDRGCASTPSRGCRGGRRT
jgi:hypothetical protein